MIRKLFTIALTLLPIAFLFFTSCDDDVPPKYYSKPADSLALNAGDRDSFFMTLSSNVMMCDSCESVLVVEHDECTECRDFYVDSGTVFISFEDLRKADSLIKHNVKTQTSDKIPLFRGRLNTHDFYFSDTSSFSKLWKNFDFEKKYRITGVVEFDSVYILKFRMKSFQKLSKKEAENFD